MRVQVTNLDGAVRGSIIIDDRQRYLLTDGKNCLGDSIKVLAVHDTLLDLFRVTPEQYKEMHLEDALYNHQLGYHESSLLQALEQ